MVEETTETETPKRRSRRVSTPTVDTAAAVDAATAAPTDSAAVVEEAPKKTTRRRTTKKADAEAPAADAAVVAEEAAVVEEAPKKTTRRRTTKKTAAASSEAPAAENAETGAAPAQKDADASEAADAAEKPKRGRRRATASSTKANAKQEETAESEKNEDAVESTNTVESAAADADKHGDVDKSSDAAKLGDSEKPGDTDGDNQKSDREMRNGRQRTRQRDRKRRNTDDSEELTESDVLLPIAGILDVLDNYAFVRTTGYLPGATDVYVSLSQVKRHNLRKGDAIVGAIRQPREGENGGRQKYNALIKIDTINGQSVEEAASRGEFSSLTPISPDQTVVASSANNSVVSRLFDLFAPLALGQRGLIEAQSGTGATETLLEIGKSFGAASPETHVMHVLVSARPEEVTELSRRVDGELIAAAADSPTDDKLTVVELALERAKRLVELGHDVVLLIDRLSDLAIAHESALMMGKNSTALMIGGNPTSPGNQLIRQVFATARNVENGGSLAIYAAVDTLSAFGIDLPSLANWQISLDEGRALLGNFPNISVSRAKVRGAAALQGENVYHTVKSAIKAVSPAEGPGDAFFGDPTADIELTDIVANAKTLDDALIALAKR
ncbi:transcription termination factor Rho [Canibacter zhoujuaniae]|uniref:transcription termination factor Rho n=1 Tax=Canibacter zhoujuaniae TaxID=2708343 RepID=UPI001421087F|nr:transcription termination factor Rho [Canibacter zhoujuaniae]